ncbi:MAG: CoA-transferase [Alphaproteobacteria bacterium]
MSGTGIVADVEALAALVPDGTRLGVPKDTTGVAMALTRALVRRGVKNLHVVALPQSGIQSDILIGAGCVDTVETAAVTLSEHGLAPCFIRAVKTGAIKLKDSTCPAIYAGMQAGVKGQPFVPIRGLIGSDLVAHRADEYRVIDNPLQPGDPLVIVPAIRPDIAVFHAAMADRDGNVYVGAERDCFTLAHAAMRCLVTVEEIVDDNLLADRLRRPATIPSIYIEAVAEARQGAWPLALGGSYGPDNDHLALYAKMAGSPEGFVEYVERFVMERAAAAE